MSRPRSAPLTSTSVDLLEHLAGGGTVVLDGGLGTHLGDRGQDVTGALWSAAVLRDHPEAVRAAHEDFFAAGAQVATACTYQVSAPALAHVGADPREDRELIARAVSLAREAATAVRRDGAGDGLRGADGDRDGTAPRWVLASVGPYGACPGVRGSEYDADHGVDQGVLAAWHRPRLELLARSGADALLIETIPGILEVRALIGELERIGVRALLSVTIAGDAMRDGTALSELAEIVRGTPAVAGLGVNCCAPEDAVAAVRSLRELVPLPLLAYPNSGETWDREMRTWQGPGEQGAEWAQDLLAAGAQMVGGCCRVGPEEIARIAQVARELGHGAPRRGA